MSGPAPKDPAARARRNWSSFPVVRLPAEGRKGRAPAWPLLPDVNTAARRDSELARAKRLRAELDGEPDGRTRRRLRRELTDNETSIAVLTAQLRARAKLERSVWASLWRTPQATQWERLGWTRDVAQFVRWRVLGELGDLRAAIEARQWSDRLGLNPAAMQRLRWEVDTDDTAATALPRRADSPAHRYRTLRILADDDHPSVPRSS